MENIHGCVLFDQSAQRPSLFVSVFISLVETDNPYRWKGYVVAVTMFVVGSVFGVTIHYSVMTRDRADLRIKIALTAAIYRKVRHHEGRGHELRFLSAFETNGTINVQSCEWI